ncbi:replication factor C subunit 3-like isoform X2 [Salvia divinorum]|uniref:Replication factor C subunit 3-like isoform X2 n=1 Tax=Salvia divinorum TaxID=28513 RepID=A0ABD1FVK2_SALDI
MASNSQNNLRQAIRSFEATWHNNDCNASLTEAKPKQLYSIRREFQNLIEHIVAPEFIFQTLKEELKKILPEQLQLPFNRLSDEYKYQNVQKFMRIEEFMARFMSWYNDLVMKIWKFEQIKKVWFVISRALSSRSLATIC